MLDRPIQGRRVCHHNKMIFGSSCYDTACGLVWFLSCSGPAAFGLADMPYRI